MNRKEVWGLTSVVSASRANSINGVCCGTNRQVSVLTEVEGLSFSTLAHTGMHDASCIHQTFDICKNIYQYVEDCGCSSVVQLRRRKEGVVLAY